jgi:hypothetical protein
MRAPVDCSGTVNTPRPARRATLRAVSRAPGLAALALWAAGCGSGAAGPDGHFYDGEGPDLDAAGYAFSGPPVTLPSAPPQIATQGGPTYPDATVISVSWRGDPNAPAVDRFLQRWVGSALYLRTLREYGVQSARFGGAYQLATPPCTAPCAVPYDPSTGADGVVDLIHRAVRAGELPAPSPRVVYHVTLPPGITALGGCDLQYAYHNWTSDLGGYAYAVNYVCATDELSDVDVLTINASHEVAEVVTDPLVGGSTAFALRWDSNGGGEVCDYCGWWYVTDGGFKIQRVWSNEAAAAGFDPCVPYGPGFPSNGTFGVAPTSASPVHVRPGGSAALEIRAYASGGYAGPLQVSARATVQGVTVTPDREVTLAPGASATFTVSADGTAAAGESAVELYAYPPPHVTFYSVWPVHLVVP